MPPIQNPSSALTFGTYTRRYVRPLWHWYFAGMALLAIVNAINLYVPQYAKEIINRLTQGQSLNDASSIALLIVGLGILLIITRSFSRILIFWPGRKIETETKADLFTKILALPEEFFTRIGLGDLISRLSNDTGTLRAFFAFGMLQILNVLFLCVMTLWMMVKTNLILTVLVILPLLLMIVISRYAMPKMQEGNREQQKAIGELTTQVTESFVNVHVIQANSAEESFVDKVSASNNTVYNTNIRVLWIRTMIFPLMSLLAGLSQLAVLLYGGYLVTEAELTVGDILAFNVYIGLLTFPLTAMGIIIAVFQRAKTALERLSVIETAPYEGQETEFKIAENSNKKSDLPRMDPKSILVVKDLTYIHKDSKHPVLRDLSLRIDSSTKIGLFGKVGSGKTTLFNLITRLYDPPRGTIFFEGQDILTIPPQELRQKIGYALQGVHLFSATIKENLSFGLSYLPSIDELEEAAHGACILEDIRAFTKGWETEVGEKGIRLSGGQKQRLALARILLRRKSMKLLLLDDVLSAVDHATETTMLRYLEQLKTPLIMSSHRPSTLKSCTEILALAEGRIQFRGDFSAIAAQFPEIGGGII
jgi:ATP-binding cassette subfamily B multidrug efflux pump